LSAFYLCLTRLSKQGYNKDHNCRSVLEMMMVERIYRAMLLTVSGIGSAKLRKLVDYYDEVKTIWGLTHQELTQSRILNAKELDEFLLLRNRIDCAEIERKWAQAGIHCCSIDDSEYPPLLRHIFDPPPILFYRGHMQLGCCFLAVVGSRNSTPYGRNVAHLFSEELSRAGVIIVSGAATGIDSSAHEGALAAGAATIAVLGCGVDVPYPRSNSALLEQIARRGCIISEYPPGTPPSPGQFPARNRIVAGMSVGVLVVEAAIKSGALITADFALNENREVYAVPGSIFSDLSRGTHRLIQQGARLVGSADDLLEELGMLGAKPSEKASIHLEADEKSVLSELSCSEPTAVDTLVLRLGMDVSKIMVILLKLEMAGYVLKDSYMGYSRVAKECV
jgi:DNA processing protein